MRLALILIWLIVPCWIFSQQAADATFQPEISSPAYESGMGPVIFIDGGHFNFHTKEGRYKPFADLLEQDGYRVLSYQGSFDSTRLKNSKILVISNAMHQSTVDNWVLPNPSAFTREEIEVIRSWVQQGGRLFLIADHMPMAGAAQELAAAFDFEFTNGFVMDTLAKGPSYFKLQDSTLHPSTITRGRDDSEQIQQVATFTGQAFKIPDEATPILTFDQHHVNLLPDTAWVFNAKTTRHNAKGWHQGAFMEYGKGRIVMFGEAAMFSAQVAGPNRVKVGMNHPQAGENYQLLLNLIHWLDGIL